MKSLAALLLKDCRAVRGWIAVTWLLVVVIMLCPQRGTFRDDVLGWPAAVSWLAAGSWLLVILMQQSLLAVDPPAGDRRFIGTRPVSGMTVWGSKAMVVLVAGVLPTALAMAVRLWSSRLGVSFGEGLLVAFEDGMLLLCVLGILSLRQIVPGHSLWMAGAALFISLVTLYFARIMTVFQVHRSIGFIHWLNSMRNVSALMLVLGFVIWAALAGRYARWRWWMRLIAVITVAVVMMTATIAWMHDYQFGSVESSPPAGISIGAEPADSPNSPVILADEEGSALSCHLYSPESDFVEIQRYVKIKNLPPGVWLEQTMSEGTMRLEGEQTDRPFWHDTHGSESWNVPPQAAAGALPGTPVLTTPWDTRFLTVASGRALGVKKNVPFKATLRGQYHFDVYRAELVTLLPITQGLVWTGRHVRLEIAEVLALSRKEARFRIMGDVFRLQSSGVDRGKLSPGVNEYGFYGINLPAQRLFLMGGSRWGDVSTALQRRTQTLEHWGFGLGAYRWLLPGETAPRDERAEEKEKLDQRQTQIGIFRRIKIGSIVAPFEYVDQFLWPRQ